MIRTKEDLKMTFIRNEGAVAKKWVGIVGCEWVASFQNSYYLCLDKNGRATFMPKYSALARSCSAEWLANEGYRELTFADFEPEEEVVPEPEVKPTHTKESLTGIKVRINGREQWEWMKALCESVGLEHATWQLCDFTDNTQGFMCGWEGKFLASCHWYDDEDTSNEFANLREVQYGDLFVVEDAVSVEVNPAAKYKYTLVDKSPEEIYRAMLDGEVFYEHDGEVEVYFDEDSFLSRDTNNGARKFIKGITNDNQICTREEVKWQDEVVYFLNHHTQGEGFLDASLPDGKGKEFTLSDEDFLEAARIALKAVGELS